MRATARSWRDLYRWIAICGLLGLLSCAYYNTFFVAKKSFRAAEKSVRESRDAPVPQDARRDYATTIKQCRKVLVNHAGSRWVDDAIYLMAASYYGVGEYDSALIRVEELETRFPDSRFRVDALFLAGLARAKQREFEQADSLFDRVIQEYPDFERKDEILLAQAELAATQRDRPRAIRHYGELARRYPRSLRVEEALERAGQLHFEEGSYDSASFYFGRLLERVRGREMETDAAILQAQALVRLDRADEALDLLHEVEPEDTDTPASRGGQMRTIGDDLARIRLEQAAALNRLGNHNEAIETLQEVASQQGSGRAIEAQFQIGYAYETMLDSLEAARTSYDKIATMPGRSIFKDQAVQRSGALKSLAELQETAGSGDEAQEARADAALRIAEILFLDRKLIDEAVEKYREVEGEFPDSRAAPQAAYALAYIRWKEQGDSLDAQEDFRDLVARYPASSQARGVIDLLARQRADTTGLFALLVMPEPETLAVAVDTMGGTGIAGFDSLAPPTGDSLALARIDLAGPPIPDSLAFARTDSLEASPLDSVGVSPADSGVAASVDSLRRSVAGRRAEIDSLVRAREQMRDRLPERRPPDRPRPPYAGETPREPREPETPEDRENP